MKKLMFIVGAALISSCCMAGNGPKDSGTTFAKDALAPYVENGQLPGAINVFYKNGLQETACVGYANVATKRPITMDDVFMQCSQTKGFCGVTIAMRVEEVRNVQETIALQPKIDKCRLHAGQDAGHAALMNTPCQRVFIGPLKINFHQLAILENSEFGRVAVLAHHQFFR